MAAMRFAGMARSYRYHRSWWMVKPQLRAQIHTTRLSQAETEHWFPPTCATSAQTSRAPTLAARP
ncbi:hypothetical protein SAMN05216190_11622 [Pseudomonas borbori]|uniref:Uncharacterized protein n=1 Tax=Pseudomonas borbori TaxID=289003 RepID=A0A1I5SG63_9PSED|nr:hypothetical protein SAMN05216190_11622 [Pseudomonas borbori]